MCLMRSQPHDERGEVRVIVMRAEAQRACWRLDADLMVEHLIRAASFSRVAGTGPSQTQDRSRSDLAFRLSEPDDGLESRRVA
jgi:hypothetical protein